MLDYGPMRDRHSSRAPGRSSSVNLHLRVVLVGMVALCLFAVASLAAAMAIGQAPAPAARPRPLVNLLFSGTTLGYAAPCG